jgi:aspartyl-tRNA synthetase
VIAFPKTAKAVCLLSGAPTVVEDKLLAENRIQMIPEDLS